MSHDVAAEESVIIEYGRKRVMLYPTKDYEEALVRHFTSAPSEDKGFIVLDSSPHGQGFTSAAAAWSVDNGLLKIERVIQGDQEQVTTLSLTDKGKELCRGKLS
jgi:hypothetical protein